tara:strand:- start:75 stop:557 length:483 start_codon:yes stop_codon:yes gene_type:complete
MKGKLKEWLKTNGKNALGKALDFAGGEVPIPILGGAIEWVGEQLMNDKDLTPEQQKEVAEIIQLELEELDLRLKDVQNARNREIEIAKTGKKDPMMLITGIIGISVFVFMVVAIVFKPELQENKLLIHLLGMVEGVAITIFSYYYGSSKGSKDKTKLLGK